VMDFPERFVPTFISNVQTIYSRSKCSYGMIELIRLELSSTRFRLVTSKEMSLRNTIESLQIIIEDLKEEHQRYTSITPCDQQVFLILF